MLFQELSARNIVLFEWMFSESSDGDDVQVLSDGEDGEIESTEERKKRKSEKDVEVKVTI